MACLPSPNRAHDCHGCHPHGVFEGITIVNFVGVHPPLSCMDVVKPVCYGLLVGVPVAVAFYDLVGCPAKVVGPSMRVCLCHV